MCSELYTADGDQKAIFPVIYENVRFEDNEKSMGVKYVIGGINWLFFRPNVDDYPSSLLNLIGGLKKQGQEENITIYITGIMLLESFLYMYSLGAYLTILFTIITSCRNVSVLLFTYTV